MTATDTITLLFQVVVLLFSVMIHEIAHGAVALALGDRTARDAGRLTLNPLKHLDPFGSIILPAVLLYLGGFVFGWAKPVPYNPFALRHPRRDSALVGIAGPLTNFCLAVAFAIGLRALQARDLFDYAHGSVAAFFVSVVIINVSLAIFNLLPIPPLDGSKALFALFSDRYMGLKMVLERYGMLILVFFIFVVGTHIVAPVIRLVLTLLLGTELLPF